MKANWDLKNLKTMHCLTELFNRELLSNRSLRERVFVLGAGASVNGGYPLAPSVLDYLAKWFEEPRNLTDRRRVRIAQLRAKYPSESNFEDILRLLGDETNDQIEIGSDWFDRRHLREDVASSLRDCFIDTGRRKEAPAYECFAERIVQQGDLPITFNYDVSLERALKRSGKWDIGSGYGFEFLPGRDDSAVKLLKLHGSVNWFHRVPDEPFPPLVMWLDLLGYPDLKDPRVGAELSVNNLGTLVLPEPRKTFYWKRLWERLWAEAEGAVRSADELVILGYSMPKADEASRKLLLGAPPSACISIYSTGHSENIAEQFRKQGCLHVYPRPGVRFEDWVRDGFIPSRYATSGFRAGEFAKQSRWRWAWHH